MIDTIKIRFYSALITWHKMMATMHSKFINAHAEGAQECFEKVMNIVNQEGGERP